MLTLQIQSLTENSATIPSFQGGLETNNGFGWPSAGHLENYRLEASSFNGLRISILSTLAYFCLLLSLKPLDIEFMKRLHDKVNVIPLIAKADTLTPEECQLFKKQVFMCACTTPAINGVPSYLFHR